MIRVPSNGRARAAMVALMLGGIALLVSACPKTVPQDSKSGEDAKPKGAKAITLDNNEGSARGIVTYPGGDRVDWKHSGARTCRHCATAPEYATCASAGVSAPSNST